MGSPPRRSECLHNRRGVASANPQGRTFLGLPCQFIIDSAFAEPQRPPPPLRIIRIYVARPRIGFVCQFLLLLSQILRGFFVSEMVVGWLSLLLLSDHETAKDTLYVFVLVLPNPQCGLGVA